MSNIIRLEKLQEMPVVEQVFEDTDMAGDGEIICNPFPEVGTDIFNPNNPEQIRKPVQPVSIAPDGNQQVEELVPEDKGPDLSELIEMIEKEQAERESKIQEAYERGLSDGEKQRRITEQKLAEQYQYGLEKLELLGRSLETLARHESLEIAMLISKKIMQKEIISNPLTLIEIAKNASVEVMGKKELTIKLNPDDLKAIKELKPDLESYFPAVANITLDDDEDLERGDCMVDTDVEQINLSLDEQLKVIKKALEE